MAKVERNKSSFFFNAADVDMSAYLLKIPIYLCNMRVGLQSSFWISKAVKAL